MIHSIQADDVIIEDEEAIRTSMISIFQNLLTSDLDELPPPSSTTSSPSRTRLIVRLSVPPSIAEIRETIFVINNDSVFGPDGFSSLFFHTCWEFVASDVEAVVLQFFAGFPLPHSYTTTTIILLLKHDHLQSWSHFRPISICN